MRRLRVAAEAAAIVAVTAALALKVGAVAGLAFAAMHVRDQWPRPAR